MAGNTAQIQLSEQEELYYGNGPKWCQRFMVDRLNALSDAPRPGKPHKHTEETEKRVLALLDTLPPEGYSQWNGRLLAED